MSKIKPLKTMLGISFLIMVIGFVVCYLVYKDIENKNEDYQIISHDLSLKNNRFAYLTSAIKTLNDLGSDINNVENSIISKDGEVKFLEDLELMAKESGLIIEINSLAFENNSKLASSSIDILKIRAKTSGSWRGSYGFLAKIESLPFKVRINRFSLTSNGLGNASSEDKTGVYSQWDGLFDIDVLKYK